MSMQAKQDFTKKIYKSAIKRAAPLELYHLQPEDEIVENCNRKNEILERWNTSN